MEVKHYMITDRGIVLNGEVLPHERLDQADALFERVSPTLRKKHNAQYEFTGWTSSVQLPVILSAAQGNLEGKKVLDLGAGATRSTEDFGFLQGLPLRDYEPWLSRVLHELGVDVTAVDEGEFEEEFTSYGEVNLLAEGSLDFLEDHSFDIANASQLLDSPYLHMKYGVRIGHELKDNLEKQLERILKPEGVFLYGPNEPAFFCD